MLGAGPNSVQFGAEVGLANTPTSVATNTCDIGRYTMTAFAGESGRLAVKSTQLVPPLVVFHTPPVAVPTAPTLQLRDGGPDGPAGMEL